MARMHLRAWDAAAIPPTASPTNCQSPVLYSSECLTYATTILHPRGSLVPACLGTVANARLFGSTSLRMLRRSLAHMHSPSGYITWSYSYRAWHMVSVRVALPACVEWTDSVLSMSNEYHAGERVGAIPCPPASIYRIMIEPHVKPGILCFISPN